MKFLFRNTTVLFVTLLLVFSVETYSQAKGQVVGKIISTSEANQLFGPPLKSFTFNAKMVLMLTKRSPEYIMFNIINDNVVVLDARRKVLHPDGLTVASQMQFHLFSTSKVLELLDLIGSNKLTLQIRANNILTITGDELTEEDGSVLEYALHCPPICPQ